MHEQYIQLLKKQLIYDMQHQKKNGTYGYFQRTMAYNSNKIEGSTLTKRQTANIFETGTINAEKDVTYRTKDIEEMTGHFRMFNQTLQELDKPLSEEIIKQMHYNLKIGVFEDMANGYPCGEYKNRKNFVADIETALPEDVPAKIKSLLEWYHSIKIITLYDLAKFHVEYESIHPFQDGNGRTGRMILFRESLKHNMVPIIIQDNAKNIYLEQLSQAQKQNNFRNLTQFLEEQQAFIYQETKDIVIPYNDRPLPHIDNEDDDTQDSLDNPE